VRNVASSSMNALAVVPIVEKQPSANVAVEDSLQRADDFFLNPV
jgi:hypothetical protein